MIKRPRSSSSTTSSRTTLPPLDAEEFYRLLEGVVIDDSALFTGKLQEWENFYNFHRPHGGLGGPFPTNGSDKRHRPARERPLPVAHLAVSRVSVSSKLPDPATGAAVSSRTWRDVRVLAESGLAGWVALAI
jgi:hypothetical protein